MDSGLSSLLTMSEDVRALLEALSQWLRRHDFAVVEDRSSDDGQGLQQVLRRRDLRVQLLNEPTGWAIEGTGVYMAAWFDMDIWAAAFDETRAELSPSALNHQADYLMSNADRMVIAVRDDPDLATRLMAHQRGRWLRRRGPPPLPEAPRRTTF